MKNETATPERATVPDNNGKDKVKEITMQVSLWLFFLIFIYSIIVSL